MKQTKNKTLLDQVKSVPINERNSTTDPDIAVAWLKGEVRQSQISKTIWPDKMLGSTATLVYCFLNRSIREAYRQGKIKIVE